MTAAARVPAGWRLAPDVGTRRIDGGQVVLGGTPFRVWRLSDDGAQRVGRLLAGEPVGDDPLARRLLDAGMAHPIASAPSHTADDVTVVIPFLGSADELADVLAAIGPAHEVLVVDDGSSDPRLAGVAEAAGARLLRHDRTRGPAAARNTGWRAAETEVIAFVDADCRPAGGSTDGTGHRRDGAEPRSSVTHAVDLEDVGTGSRPEQAMPGPGAAVPGWLGRLVAHLDDPAVAAVAPRITAGRTDGLPAALAAYERTRPPLDRGTNPAVVRPGSRVPFVPSATLVVRRSDLEAVGGFDDDLRFGEDVDLVWRLVEAGRTVRYEPAVTVPHDARRAVGAWLRQRYHYGGSAVPLAERHGAAVRPLAVPAPVAGAVGFATLAAIAPRRVAPIPAAAVLVVAARTTQRLAARLAGPPPAPDLTPDTTTAGRGEPSARDGAGTAGEAVRLSAISHAWGLRSLVDALRRPWCSVTAAALGSRRTRRLAVAVAVVPPLVEWARTRPAGLDPIQWTALRAADDLAYGLGVVAASLRHRTVTALRPAVTRRRS